jgi:hypothetical protein
VSDDSLIVFLIVGAALVVADGQLIYRSGAKYLAASARQGRTGRASAGSIARLVSVLFYFAMLGIIALVSVIHFPAATPVSGVVLRLGVILLLLAAVHAASIVMLNKLRDRFEAEDLTQRYEQAQSDRADRLADRADPVAAAPADRLAAERIAGDRLEAATRADVARERTAQGHDHDGTPRAGQEPGAADPGSRAANLVSPLPVSRTAPAARSRESGTTTTVDEE